jgi:hypothetical protein
MPKTELRWCAVLVVGGDPGVRKSRSVTETQDITRPPAPAPPAGSSRGVST